jgi:hypothetical protein
VGVDAHPCDPHSAELIDEPQGPPREARRSPRPGSTCCTLAAGRRGWSACVCCGRTAGVSRSQYVRFQRSRSPTDGSPGRSSLGGSRGRALAVPPGHTGRDLGRAARCGRPRWPGRFRRPCRSCRGTGYPATNTVRYTSPHSAHSSDSSPRLYVAIVRYSGWQTGESTISSSRSQPGSSQRSWSFRAESEVRRHWSIEGTRVADRRSA